MNKKVLGFLLVTIGFGGMFLAGFLFMTGHGGKMPLIEITGYMLTGAFCFFTGINYVYAANKEGTEISRTSSSPEEVSSAKFHEQWQPAQLAEQDTIENVR